MKLQGKAYVVAMDWGKKVCIASGSGSEAPLHIGSFARTDYESAENLCLSLNNWRESYAQDCIDQTISLMEEINDQVRVEKIAGS